MAEVLYCVLGGGAGQAGSVAPDGHAWGRAETLPLFVVIRFPGVPVAECTHFVEKEASDESRWVLTPSDLPFAVRQVLASDDVIVVGGGSGEISWNELEAAIKDSSNNSPGRPPSLPAHADRFRSTSGAALISDNPGPGYSGLAAFREAEFAANLARREAHNEVSKLQSRGGTPSEIAAAQSAASNADAAWQAAKQANGTGGGGGD